MPLHFRALSAALSIAAAAAVIAPGHAQQSPLEGAQERVPDARAQDGAAPPVPTAPGSPRASRPRPASVISTVNLRSGPGTDSEIVTTIPAGSAVRVTNCSGEWCEVTWNGSSGYAIARNLSTGGPRQAGAYGPPGYAQGYGPEPPVGYAAPGYYAPPGVAYGPAYYYGPRVYYGPGWGWRRRGWW